MSLDDDALARLRATLDAVDAQLVEALAARQRTVAEVAALKSAEADRPLRDVDRESALLGKVVDRAEALGLDPGFVTRLYQDILDHSVRRQQQRLSDGSRPDDDHVVVAHLGAPGSYSQQAAAQHFESHDAPVVHLTGRSFRELADAVHRGDADYAVLPVENTTAGSINEVYDLLRGAALHIVGEVVQRIDHCLVGVDETVTLDRIRRVRSHPQAISQCRDFLRRLPQAHVESVSDTATAVLQVKAEQDLSQAAIASAAAARLHGLPILRADIADQRENFTRFVVVCAQATRFDVRVACKTSLVFATRHEDGALVRALNVLADAHLNLTKLESRPEPGKPWEYIFYVDFEGNVADPATAAALERLGEETAWLRVLGSYPARTTGTAQPATPAGR